MCTLYVYGTPGVALVSGKQRGHTVIFYTHCII